MPDYFNEALGDFVKNFAWGGVIEHLLNHGYTIDRMISEERVSLTHEQIRSMIEKMNERRVREGLPPYPIR